MLKIVYNKSYAEQRMAITGLFTLLKCPDLLELYTYVDNIPVETGI